MRTRRTCGVVGSAVVTVLTVVIATAEQSPPRFGGAYSQLDQRRQHLVDDWVERFIKVTGQSMPAQAFYDDVLSLSGKTTFDAVSHALLTTPLTDASGRQFGDGLGLIERVDTVRGEVPGASSDRQFRMYARLTPTAREMLERSREFERGVDNAVYHKGYPVNYRQQRGTPSIQVSIALDGRLADIDVDYRSSTFPVSLFNGHLSAANSDVRAGDNADRHAARWTGFQNWWRNFFGVRLERTPDALETTATFAMPRTPRAGRKDIEVRPVDPADQSRFVIYEVASDLAASFDCETRLLPGMPRRTRSYGNHYGAAFRVAGPARRATVALLWAREDGYWKIVSWQTAPESDGTPAPPAPSGPAVVRIKADRTLVQAARDFLDTWLVRRNYDAAFRYLSTKSYACYDLLRAPDAPASTSLEDAGHKLRASLQRIGQWVGTPGDPGAVVEAAEPVHPAIRVMEQPYARMFSLTSFPTALGDALECEARTRGAVPPDPLPLDYGEAFGMTFRFRTQGGDAPVLRLLWRREDDAWRVTAYEVELP